MTSMPPSPTPAAFQLLSSSLGGPSDLVPLFALAYDIAAFEADIPNFAAQTGIPAEELRSIAADARQGSDPGARVRPGQHVVSRSLLVHWCTGTNRRNQRIWRYSLATGPQPEENPTDVGKVDRYVKIDSERTEKLWETVENDLRSAVAQIVAGTGLADPTCVTTIKNVIALHYAGSIETLENVEELFGSNIAKKKADMLADHALIDRLFAMKTGDTSGIKTDAERVAFVDHFHSRLEWLYTSGTYFRYRVAYLYHAVGRIIDPLNLQVLRAPAGQEFLISDAPVITSDATGGRRGVANQMAIGNVDTVVMPLTPSVSVALDPIKADSTVDAAYVRRLNLWQLEAAKYDVFMLPRSPLMPWVEATRPPTASAAP